MKITNAFFEQNLQGSPLVKLCKSNGLPVKTSYLLSRLLQKLDPFNAVYNNERKKLIEKWCDKKEDGSPLSENGEYKFTYNLHEFNMEFQELLSIELEIDMDVIEISISKIPVGILNSFDYIQLIKLIDFKED